METIEYQLKSNPEKSVRVPADYASEAENVVKLAVENPMNLAIAVHEKPYFGNPRIFARTVSLAKAPESLKLQDEVYLRVCVYGNERKMMGPDGDEAMGLDGALVEAIENL